MPPMRCHEHAGTAGTRDLSRRCYSRRVEVPRLETEGGPLAKFDERRQWDKEFTNETMLFVQHAHL